MGGLPSIGLPDLNFLRTTGLNIRKRVPIVGRCLTLSTPEFAAPTRWLQRGREAKPLCSVASVTHEANTPPAIKPLARVSVLAQIVAGQPEIRLDPSSRSRFGLVCSRASPF